MLSYPSGDQELCVPELEKMETAFQAETCNMKRVWLGGGRREGVCVILGLQNAQKINKIRLLKKKRFVEERGGTDEGGVGK